MSLIQYSTLLPMIRSALGNRDNPDIDIMIKAAFNAVQNMLARKKEWRELQAIAGFGLSSITNYITITNTSVPLFYKPYSVVVDSSPTGSSRARRLQYITPLKWDTEILPKLGVTPRNWPVYYTLWNLNMYLFPRPDTNYNLSLKYYQFPEPVVNEDSWITYVHIDELLQFGTIALSFLLLEEYELASVWDKRFQQLAAYYDIEASSITEGFKSSVEGGSGISATGDYWNDPFQKETP